MRIEIANNCPLDGFKPCRGPAGCGWIVKLKGKNPQSEEEIDEYGCAIAWLPVLLVENAQQVRQSAAAVESFRNEMAKPGNAMMAVLYDAIEGLRAAIVQQNAGIVPALLAAAAQRIEVIEANTPDRRKGAVNADHSDT